MLLIVSLARRYNIFYLVHSMSAILFAQIKPCVSFGMCQHHYRSEAKRLIHESKFPLLSSFFHGIWLPRECQNAFPRATIGLHHARGCCN